MICAMAEANSPVMWSLLDWSEPVTKGQNNGIKIGYYERSISQTEAHKLLRLHSIYTGSLLYLTTASSFLAASLQHVGSQLSGPK